MRDKKFLQKVKWEYIIVDEAHRLKNPKCKLAVDLAQYSSTSRRVALTGTPLQVCYFSSLSASPALSDVGIIK
jgi:SWI/SNF-related matrix-associated actin-dependent regulator of chromatin subfamily A protein 2/4